MRKTARFCNYPVCDFRILGVSDAVLKKGIKIKTLGASDGILTAIQLENGHHALVYRDFKPFMYFRGAYIIDHSDCPAVTWAIWNATGMPTPVQDARGGRMKWDAPGVGRVFIFYNEKKEDMYYHPDYVSIESKSAFIERYGGYPIILYSEPNEVFSLNSFLIANRLYVTSGAFVTKLLPKGGTSEERFEKSIHPDTVLENIHLLAQDLQIPLKVLVKEGEAYVWKGPFSP